jgi:hypothetical protein
MGNGDIEDISSDLEALRQHLADMPDGEVKAWLMAKVPEYRPPAS